MLINAAQVLVDATLQREEFETPQVIPHSQSQDGLEASALICHAPLVDEDATRGGLVDAEHAEAVTLNFLVSPLWARVPVTAAASLLWTSYVSFSRGCPGPCPQNAPTRCDGVRG